jgi:Golgi phosphoprotein 3
MSTITRRRVGGGQSGDDNNPDSPNPRTGEDDRRVAYDPRDIDESKSIPKLTLMEEVLLLGLKDKQVK